MFRLVKSHDYDFIQVKDKFLSALMGHPRSPGSGTRLVYWLS